MVAGRQRSRSRRPGRAGGAALVGLVLVIDLVAPLPRGPLLVNGLLDELAHLSTAWLVLRLLPALPRATVGWALAASVLLDVDHVPSDILQSDVLTAGTGRPYSHSALTVLVLLLTAVAVPRWRAAAAGAGLGVTLHLARDLATGPGVPLLWPLSWDDVQVPYVAYAIVVSALAAIPLLVPASRHTRGGRRPAAVDRTAPLHTRSSAMQPTQPPAHGAPAAAGRPSWLGDVKVSVVVPALNEADNLPYVLPRMPPWLHEVILVDDHSTDRTAEVARELLPDIRVVPNERPGGKGNALRTGFEAVTGDIIVQIDADGSEAPEEIPAFVGALLAGADYAKGTRFVPGGGTSDMTGLRRWGNYAFVLLVWALFRVRFTDLCYGYNAFWTRVLPQLEIDAQGFEIEAMFNLRAVKSNLKIREVPSYEADRVHGEGRLLTWPDGWRVLRTILHERFADR